MLRPYTRAPVSPHPFDPLLPREGGNSERPPVPLCPPPPWGRGKPQPVRRPPPPEGRGGRGVRPTGPRLVSARTREGPNLVSGRTRGLPPLETNPLPRRLITSECPLASLLPQGCAFTLTRRSLCGSCSSPSSRAA